MTGRRRSGTPRPVPRSSPSRGTPVASSRRRSAPTARGSSPGVRTRRRRSGTPRRRRGPHPQGAHRLVIRRRSARTARAIVTASNDNTAKVWDAKSGAEVLTLKGHTGWSLRRRSARTARGSSPGVMTGRRRSGTPRRCRDPHAQGAHRCRHFGVVQPGRLADRHRRVTTRRRRSGTRRSGAEVLTLKGHTARHFGVVQPGRLADRHRECRTRRRRSGTPRAVPRSSHSRGTPSRHFGVVQPRRLARSSPRARTRRRRSGTPRAAPRSSRSRGTPASRHSASFSPDGSRIVTASCGQDGEGLGREQRRRGPHAQGAHRHVLLGVVQPGRLADRHRES